MLKRLFKKKVDKYDCKWNEPWEGAPWGFQSCNCAERKSDWGIMGSCSLTPQANEHLIDFSCAGVDCGFFESKEK